MSESREECIHIGPVRLEIAILGSVRCTETLEEVTDGGADLEEYQSVTDGQCPVDGSVPATQESFRDTVEEAAQWSRKVAQEVVDQPVLGLAVDTSTDGS